MVTHRIGAHTIVVDGPWVEMTFVDVVDLAASIRMHALVEQVLADNHGVAFVLADISRLVALDSDARRNMAEWNRTHKVKAAAIFGGGFAMRTLVGLALGAIKLMNPDQLEAVFVRDEAEARRWLTARRARG